MCCCYGRCFLFGVYLLCNVIAEGQLVQAAEDATYVLILLVGCLQQLVRDFLVLHCMYLSVDRVLTFWLRCCVYSAPVVCILFCCKLTCCIHYYYYLRCVHSYVRCLVSLIYSVLCCAVSRFLVASCIPVCRCPLWGCAFWVALVWRRWLAMLARGIYGGGVVSGHLSFL
jgi:hypothetical protein